MQPHTPSQRLHQGTNFPASSHSACWIPELIGNFNEFIIQRDTIMHNHMADFMPRCLVEQTNLAAMFSSIKLGVYSNFLHCDWSTAFFATVRQSVVVSHISKHHPAQPLEGMTTGGRAVCISFPPTTLHLASGNCINLVRWGTNRIWLSNNINSPCRSSAVKKKKKKTCVVSEQTKQPTNTRPE